MQVFHLHPNVTFFSFTTPFLDFGLGQLGHLFPTFLLLNSGFCFVYPAFCLCTSNFLIFQKCLLFILLPFMLFTHSFCFFFPCSFRFNIFFYFFLFFLLMVIELDLATYITTRGSPFDRNSICEFC